MDKDDYDDALVSLVYKHFGAAGGNILTFTRWKDNIDVKYPSIELKNFLKEASDLTHSEAQGNSGAVERIAKALVQYDIDHPEHPEWKQLPWDDLTGWEREEWRAMARAALEAAEPHP